MSEEYPVPKSSSECGETFTATERSCPDAIHSASCASALSSTQLVKGLITFVSSASEMNRSGGRRPSRGWFQRPRAYSAQVVLLPAHTTYALEALVRWNHPREGL